MSKKQEAAYADPLGSLIEIPAIGVALAAGAGAPTASLLGYAKGCAYVDYTNGALYYNTGTLSSSTWSALISAGGVLAPTTPSTPAAVATSPGTAQSAEITATGGIGGNSSLATTAVGGVGGGYSFTAGAGGVATAGATASTGGAGGAWAVTTGAGGAEAVAAVTSTGGAGGAISATTGVGGAVSAAVSGTATGGASGVLSFATGTGGAVTATSGTNVGGASGAITIGSGVGGAATGATDTGGASGSVTISTGTGGLGDTGGASGLIALTTGAAGAGGSPAVGIISINPGTNEKWRFDSVGNLTSLTSSSNVTADGSIVATGGIAMTDVLNAWIDDATHGSGTVAHLIGNQTITTSSDIRIKKHIEPFKNAMAALRSAPRLVSFEYDHPNWGGDRAAPSDEDARKWGPNARGRYVGWIAQETKERFPWVVNAGSGAECSKCRAGETCEEHAGQFWSVEYQHMVPMLTQALLEADKRIAALEARLNG